LTRPSLYGMASSYPGLLVVWVTIAGTFATQILRPSALPVKKKEAELTSLPDLTSSGWNLMLRRAHAGIPLPL